MSTTGEPLSGPALRSAISCCRRWTSFCCCAMAPARSCLVVDADFSTCSALREELGARVRLIRSPSSCSNIFESNRYRASRAEQRRAAKRWLWWRSSSVLGIVLMEIIASANPGQAHSLRPDPCALLPAADSDCEQVHRLQRVAEKLATGDLRLKSWTQTRLANAREGPRPSAT